MALTARALRAADIDALEAVLADQYRRWHAADPRLSVPAETERAARRVLRDDLHQIASWAQVADASGAAGPIGYLRAWRRQFRLDDPQVMWLPEDHLTSELFFQFAAAADQDPGAVFTMLFHALEAAVPVGPDLPWVLSLVPPVAGLDPALTALGFRATSVFAYRPRDPAPPVTPPPPGFAIRPAARGDGPALTALYLDLAAYHVANDPFADRHPPRIADDFDYVLRTVFAEPRRWVLLLAVPADRLELPGRLHPGLAGP